MRKTSTSTLISKLIVSYKGSVPVDVQLVDGNELIYNTNWHKMGKIVTLYEDLVNVTNQDHPVYVIYVKHRKNSIKPQKRERSTQGMVYSNYNMTLNTALKPIDKIMENSNKRQLINLICRYNISHTMTDEEQNLFGHEEADICQHHKLPIVPVMARSHGEV